MAPEEQAAEQEKQRARAHVQRMARRYIARGPYRLNPDPATVAHVLVGLARNVVEHGLAYCACREVTGDPARDRANLCPCPQHRADIARDGVCECGLFVSVEYAVAHPGEATSNDAQEP